jgi:DNA-binding transcriptional ArsR family regulator
MGELRYRVLRLLDERENAGTVGTPTIGDVAEALGVSLREVSLVLKSSEAMGLVSIRRYMAATEKDFAVTLKTPAFIYLESQHKSEADR